MQKHKYFVCLALTLFIFIGSFFVSADGPASVTIFSNKTPDIGDTVAVTTRLFYRGETATIEIKYDSEKLKPVGISPVSNGIVRETFRLSNAAYTDHVTKFKAIAAGNAYIGTSSAKIKTASKSFSGDISGSSLRIGGKTKPHQTSTTASTTTSTSTSATTSSTVVTSTTTTTMPTTTTTTKLFQVDKPVDKGKNFSVFYAVLSIILVVMLVGISAVAIKKASSNAKHLKRIRERNKNTKSIDDLSENELENAGIDFRITSRSYLDEYSSKKDKK